MPTIADRLLHVSSKVKRAKEHVADLQREVSGFIDTKPYKVGTKRNPQTRQLIYYIVSVEPTPSCLPLIAGDTIHNLMGALDHLAYQIICCDVSDPPPNPRAISFPIGDTAEKYESAKKSCIKGATKETIDAIDVIKPYKGGNDPLWNLYRLNNIDKHRLLITVGSRWRSFNIGAMMSGMMAASAAADPNHPFHGKNIPILNAYIGDSGAQFPLVPGYELVITGPDAEPDENIDFRFDVALYEAQIVEAQSIVEALHQFSTLVEGIVTALTPRLRDTP